MLLLRVGFFLDCPGVDGLVKLGLGSATVNFMKQRSGVKMSVLAERSGVPASTIKHYIREGLLPDTAVRTSRNMAWYDENLVDSIKLIRDLQRDRYLPLKVIKSILSDRSNQAKFATEGLARGLAQTVSHEGVALGQLLSEGLDRSDLEELVQTGLVSVHIDDDAVVAGDDLALIQTLMRARSKGFDARRLPVSSLIAYQEAVADLVRFEWQILAASVLADPDSNAADMSAAGVELGEALITLLRRKQLLPIMREMNEKTT